MATQPDSTLAPLVRKLCLWKDLDSTEREAILALPHKVERVSAGAYLVREGDQPRYSNLLLSGFAFRQKSTGDGARSISAIHFAGDVVDLQNSLLGLADHSVQALSSARVALIPRENMVQLAFDYPTVGLAMWYDTLVDGSIFREWIANVARRGAHARIAHLLCEVGTRLEAMGLGKRDEFELPITQEQLADAVGLTPVHVNRTLKDLEAQGLFERDQRRVTVSDWPALEAAGDFTDAYLHLRQPQQLLGMPRRWGTAVEALGK
jgi:CRP-like cAMP-binding protein